MMSALIIVPLAMLSNLGGYEAAISIVQEIKPQNLSMGEGVSLLTIISALAWGLGYFGQPHILVRFMAASSVKTIPAARRISMAWMIFCLAGAVAVGFVGIPYFAMHPEGAAAVSANSETVFMELSKQLFNPWIAGALLAAILAAVMSTLSCQLLVCSSALTEDIYRTFLRKEATQKELVWIGRAMVLLIAVVAIGIAQDPNAKVLGMVSYAWAGFGAAFGPVIILSVYWKHMTRNGAMAGIVVGALTVLIWKQGGWLGLYEIVPGFILGALAVVVVSRMGQASKAMQQRHDEVEAEIRQVGM